MIRSLLFKFAFSNMNNSYNGFLRKNTPSYDWHHVSNFKKQHLPVIKICRYRYILSMFLLIIFDPKFNFRQTSFMMFKFTLHSRKEELLVYTGNTNQNWNIHLRFLYNYLVASISIILFQYPYKTSSCAVLSLKIQNQRSQRQNP